MPDVIDRFLVEHVSHASLEKRIGLFAPLGLFVAFWLTRWVSRLPQDRSIWGTDACSNCGTRLTWYDRIPLLSFLWLRGRCRSCREAISRWSPCVELATPLLFSLLAIAIMGWNCQGVVESGHVDWIHYRVFYQLALVTLLIAATVIDLEWYIIPDEITIPGMLIGVLGATLGGNMQLVPLWIDWNDLFVQLNGGYIPQWIKDSSHLHGFAWSLTGLLVGGGITWIVRGLGRLVLGVEAMGFGDVTLMAMIGSFIGWQAVVFVFLLAPLCGMVLGPLLQFAAGRIAVPFGPYLSAAALLVLFTWKWLWIPSRTIFGHPQSLALLAGVSLVGLVGLLFLLRLYRAIPIPARHSKPKPTDPSQPIP
jgi:leader peptidase (prepilin peptidase)/N-methyltransferase